MHIRGCGHFPTIHLRLGYIGDAIKNTDTANNLSEWWPPRHPTVLLNVAGRYVRDGQISRPVLWPTGLP